MTNLQRALFVLLLLTASAPGLACMEPQTPTFRQELPHAQNVFVFRLTSLKLADPAPGSRRLLGSIEVLRTIKGNGNAFRHVAFASPWCYGLRLEVGHYYVAATTQNGPALRLVRGDRSVMDVSEDYSQAYPPRREQSKLQWHIDNYFKGRPLPASFRDEMYTARTAGFGSFGEQPPLPR